LWISCSENGNQCPCRWPRVLPEIQEQSEIAIESHDDSSLSTPSPGPKSDQPAGILIEDLKEDTSLCPGLSKQYRRPEVCYLLKLGGLFIKAFPTNVH